VLHALLTVLAASEEGSSKVPFYLAGGALAAFAVLVSAIGIRAHGTFPPNAGAARAVMGLAVLLAATAMASAVLTS
jgi:hypothetical protein